MAQTRCSEWTEFTPRFVGSRPLVDRAPSGRAPTHRRRAVRLRWRARPSATRLAPAGVHADTFVCSGCSLFFIASRFVSHGHVTSQRVLQTWFATPDSGRTAHAPAPGPARVRERCDPTSRHACRCRVQRALRASGRSGPVHPTRRLAPSRGVTLWDGTSTARRRTPANPADRAACAIGRPRPSLCCGLTVGSQ